MGVLDTDYDNFYLLYDCRDIIPGFLPGFWKYEIFAVFTRESTMSDSVKELVN